MFKYSIAALLLMSLTSCGGSSVDKNVADNGNANSSTTSSGTTSATDNGGAVVTVTNPGQTPGASTITGSFTFSTGATDHILSGNGTTVSSVVIGSGTTPVTKSGPSFIALTSGNGYVSLNPSGIYVISLVAGADLQHFITIDNAGAGDTIKTGTPIVNSTWLAAGKNASASFEANEVQVSDPASASLADYANYAVRTVAVESGDAAWFNFGGDTYIVENVHGEEYNFTGGTDVIIKLTGTVSLSNAAIIGGAIVL